MFRLFPLTLALAVFSRADAQPEAKPLGPEFLCEYAETRGYLLGRPVKPTPTPDGKAVLFLRSGPTDPTQSLFEFDCATGLTRELLSPGDILKGGKEALSPEEKARRERMRVSAAGFTNFHFDPDGSRILLSLSGRLFVLDRESEKVQELKVGEGTIVDPKWSPNGKFVGYVKDYDVFVYELAKDHEWAVTTGGTAEQAHGLAEFVAQEEMGRFSGYWWSADSRSIAFTETDASGVEVWHVGDPNEPASTPRKQFYPRPGKANVKVRLGIRSIYGRGTTWVKWDRQKYEYLASVCWSQQGPLTVAVQDRKQQELALLKVDPETGETTELLKETDPAFVNIRQDGPRWLADGKGFVWLGERAKGGSALELRGPDGDLAGVLSPWYGGGISQFDTDTESGRNALLRQSPTGEASLQILIPREAPNYEIRPNDLEPGVYSATFAKDLSAAALTHTGLRSLPMTTVRTGEVLRVVGGLPSVAKQPSFVPQVTLEQLGGDSGFWTAIVKPHGFDPAKKYPVIVDVYGGPHRRKVQHALRDWLLPQWLADQGFIVVAIDNRGTPDRGRDWERAIYQKFGTVPLEDQVRGLELLAEKHPQMDMDRVGIVGWSFGGYMSALAVLKRPDIYKAAVAGAPVTDWEDYDTHYTERYMGLLPESQAAYDEGSLIPLAPKLERPLLLVHGTADDNVYFRHTLKLTDALFRAGKDFEVLPLPSLTHMVPDPVVTERLWTRIAGHFEKHLGEPVPKKR